MVSPHNGISQQLRPLQFLLKPASSVATPAQAPSPAQAEEPVDRLERPTSPPPASPTTLLETAPLEEAKAIAGPAQPSALQAGATTYQGQEAKPNAWGSMFLEDPSLQSVQAVPGTVEAYREKARSGLQQRVQEVVVVGGGPGGLATAIKLAEEGLQVTVVEVRDSNYQRPHHLNARMSTLHSFVDYGIYDEVKQASGLDDELRPMAGRGFVNGREVIDSENVGQIRISDVEKALYKRAQELGVQYAPHHRVVVGSQDENGLHSVQLEPVQFVDGQLQARGPKSAAFTPDLIVVADGAGSPTRNSLGIRFLEESEGKVYLGGLVEQPLEAANNYRKLACYEGEELRHYMATGHARYPQTWVSVEADESVRQLSPEERTSYLAHRASLVMGKKIRPEDITWGAGQITVVQNRKAETTTSGNNLVMIGDSVRTGSVWQSGGLNLAMTSDIKNVVQLVHHINAQDFSREHALYQYNLRTQAATRAWHEAGTRELSGQEPRLESAGVAVMLPHTHPARG